MELLNIKEIGKKINLTDKDIETYGEYKAKINENYEPKKELGKLILITSTNPTPYGEGKTTLAIGLNDSLNKLNQKSIAILREPSLGPFFGSKGGATGGGLSTVEPSIDINLHFTGDFHAITTANNLISSIIDNHIFQGNELGIKEVCFKRCIDINDRELRNIKLSKRNDSFNITPASEIMSILCLSESKNDLKYKLEKIIIGFNSKKEEIYLKQLNCIEAIFLVLKDAIKPNLVQSRYNNPVIIHGGPFANISIGTNSLISTKLGLEISDYVIVESGFGSDMGALKYFDIVSRKKVYPEIVIINTTIQSLKYNGNEDLMLGIENLLYHINNMKKFNSNIIVSLNKYELDSKEEIEYIDKFCQNKNVDFVVSNMYSEGQSGCTVLANKVINMKENTIHNEIYDLNDSLINKITKMCTYLNCEKVNYNKKAKNKIDLYNKYKLPICIAKTPYSISDNKKLLGNPKKIKMTITDVEINNGAGFIVVYMGNIMTMPGLGKNPKCIKNNSTCQ